MTNSLHCQINGKIDRLLMTLSEIQRILYLDEDFRTAKNNLRLHNWCFQQFVLLKEIFPVEKLGERITRDRFFGKYQHNLYVHALLQYRFVNGKQLIVKMRKFASI